MIYEDATVRVRCVEARNLPKADTFGLSDPFCEVKIGSPGTSGKSYYGTKKTQVITPTLLGEIVFDVCQASMRQLLNPELTASWEKGLTYVAEGTITPDEYMEKLERFVTLRTNGVKQTNNAYMLRPYFDAAAQFYNK